MEAAKGKGSTHTVSRGRDESPQFDRYFGTQDALIQHGLAKADWFPASLAPFKRAGAIRRTYEIRSELSKPTHNYPDRQLHVTLRHLKGSDRWELTIPVDETEQRRRWEALKRKWGLLDTKGAAVPGEQALPNIDAIVGELPPFEPGSMSNAERYAMRVLRALDDTGWDFIVNWAERWLAHGYADKSAASAKAAAHGLRLVIDNDA